MLKELFKRAFDSNGSQGGDSKKGQSTANKSSGDKASVNNPAGNNAAQKPRQSNSDSNSNPTLNPKQPLSADYDTNIKALRHVFDQCADVMFHEFVINTPEPTKAFIVFVATMSDYDLISEHLLKKALESPQHLPQGGKISKSDLMIALKERLISLPEVSFLDDLHELEDKILQGNAVLIIEGSSKAIVVGVRGGENRAIAEADTEPGVRGPKDGFVEAIDINLSLIRRRLKTSRLKTLVYEKGELTKTKVAVCYIDGIANGGLVDEVKQRIERINSDSVLESNYIEEYIMDERFSLFPLVQYSERPDKVSASLLAGRVAILVDNSPMPLLVPSTFSTMLQAAEDYYHNSVSASAIRILRFIALNLALLLPAITVAVFSFHQELLPPQMVSTVAGARQGLPLPIALEILLFEFTFELLREAGVRLPKTIGQAISTVGGLVIGQAAVNAGLVSPISVIVIAVTAIASFSVPNFEAAFSLRLLRFLLILAASILGGIGIMMGLMAILIHLCSLRSFGVPYLAPFAPIVMRDLKDSVIRAPWWALKTRPRMMRAGEVYRQGSGQGPSKPQKGGKKS